MYKTLPNFASETGNKMIHYGYYQIESRGIYYFRDIYSYVLIISEPRGPVFRYKQLYKKRGPNGLIGELFQKENSGKLISRK